MDDVVEVARRQALMAPVGLAVNQCEECGVYRLDAAPPTRHRPACSTGESSVRTYSAVISALAG
jgi:hypothetical protein